MQQPPCKDKHRPPELRINLSPGFGGVLFRHYGGILLPQKELSTTRVKVYVHPQDVNRQREKEYSAMDSR